MIKINAVQNDKGYDLQFTLQDNSGVAVDLTGVTTLYFKAQHEDASAIGFSGSMTVLNAPAGECSYTVANGNFALAGEYYAEIEATYGSGKVVTYSDIVVVVAPELPRAA